MPTTQNHEAEKPIARENLRSVVDDVVATTRFVDMHTHLFAPAFGPLGLWGVDHLLTYHYLEAEFFRYSRVRPEEFWPLPLSARADLIWQTLFIENTPISEAARGAVAALSALGLDPTEKSLEPARRFFREQEFGRHLSRVLELAGVDSVVMTNDPLDPDETGYWNREVEVDARFRAALRLDRVLNGWPDHVEQLASQGYSVDRDGGGKSVSEVRRFLEKWCQRMRPTYLAVSLPDTFQFPAEDLRTKLLSDAVLPICAELGIPLSLMIGVRRQVNPALRLAGDASGSADLRSIERLCRTYPDNRFLVSLLSRENQHELCVYARKFPNLMPFGCWWFLNNPSLVEEITRERLEMLGMSFIPQHSDARILEQLIYKWRNTRRIMTPILSASYSLVIDDGRPITRGEIERDVRRLFRTNFENWTVWPASNL